MKLELKHILPYLGHNLRLLIDGVVCEIEGIDLHQKDTVIAERINYKLEEVKPVLRSLSDLTKEIEINGEKLIPLDVLTRLFRPQSKDLMPAMFSNTLCLDIETDDYSQTIDLFDGYLIVQNLYKWNFDINDLIGKGLAININTL